jgi:hypothetical protein
MPTKPKAPMDASILSPVTGAAILQQANIPKPLHSINPRSIYGQGWWDIVRQIAYRSKDFTCHACGIQKSKAKYHQWLEAHEMYDFNYPIVKFTGLVALCHSCHNFIHSGRLHILYQKGEVSLEKFEDILARGFWVLKKENLKPWWGTAYLWLLHQGYSEQDAIRTTQERGIEIPAAGEDYPWSSYRMEIFGELYEPAFKSMGEWYEYYNGKKE